MKRYIRADIVDINDEDSEFIYEHAFTSENPRELARLAKSSDFRVREIVAKNPNTSIDTLWELTNDTHIGVRMGIINNPAAPHEIKDFIAKHRGARSGYFEYHYYLWYPEYLSEDVAYRELSKLAHSLAKNFGENYIVRSEEYYATYEGRLVYVLECGPFSDIKTPYEFNDAMKSGINDTLGYELDYTESEALIE